MLSEIKKSSQNNLIYLKKIINYFTIIDQNIIIGPDLLPALIRVEKNFYLVEEIKGCHQIKSIQTHFQWIKKNLANLKIKYPLLSSCPSFGIIVFLNFLPVTKIYLNNINENCSFYFIKNKTPVVFHNYVLNKNLVSQIETKISNMKISKVFDSLIEYLEKKLLAIVYQKVNEILIVKHLKGNLSISVHNKFIWLNRNSYKFNPVKIEKIKQIQSLTL